MSTVPPPNRPDSGDPEVKSEKWGDNQTVFFMDEEQWVMADDESVIDNVWNWA
jgi:hypothetical protein